MGQQAGHVHGGVRAMARAWAAGAVVAASAAAPAQGETISRAVQESIKAFPRQQVDALRDKIRDSQVLLRQELEVRQRALDATLKDTQNEASAKAAALDAREAQLSQARRQLAVLETSKRAIEGEAVPAQMAPLLSEVLESIATLSNPLLPVCGRLVSYKGDATHVSWLSSLDNFLQTHGPLLGAVGRVDVVVERYRPAPGGPVLVQVSVPVGTGFAVSGSRIVTAGHVAQNFWDFGRQQLRAGVVAVTFNTGAEHKFNCPAANAQAVSVKLKGVVHTKYAPDKPFAEAPLDFAVLELADGEKPLATTLRVKKSGIAPSAFVFVVGYPADDPRVEKNMWTTVMKVPVQGGYFPVADIKRISPGMVLPPCENALDVHMPHNATTLNRSSGSPILDAGTGEVVAIQVAGFRDWGDGGAACNLGLRSDAPEVTLIP